MNECVTLARARKAQTISVPAGGYFLLVGPDKPYSAHAGKRAELVADGRVSEDLDLLISGRVNNSHSNVAFVTPAEDKAAKKEAADFDKSQATGNEDAQKRQQDLDAKAAKVAREAHDGRVAEISKVNDAVRLRK